MAKDKNKQVDDSCWWRMVKCIRRCCCGSKPKKAAKKDDEMRLKAEESSDESSAGSFSPTAVVAPSSSQQVSSTPTSNAKLVSGNEKVTCFNANVNARKIDQVKEVIEKAANRKQEQKEVKITKTRDNGPKPPTTLQKSTAKRFISRRDLSKLEERRLKLKQLRSKGKDKANQKANSSPTFGGTNDKFQLPIGARGYAAHDLTDRPNRFALKYIPESASLSEDDAIVKEEHLCKLFERLAKLNFNLEVALQSYKGVVKSLIRLQVPAHKQQEVSKKWNSEVVAGEPGGAQRESQREPNVDLTLKRLSLKRLIDPATKRAAMAELQELVDELNVALDDLHVYYDDESSTFDFEEYSQSEFRITREEYNTTMGRIEKLRAVVDKLVNHYSNELIDLFELPAGH